MNFLLLCLDGYLFIVVIGNRYLSRGSKENVLSIIITGNVTMVRYVMLEVTNYTEFAEFSDIHLGKTLLKRPTYKWVHTSGVPTHQMDPHINYNHASK